MSSSVEDLLVSVPHYNCEFSMAWVQYRDTPLADFLTTCVNTAQSNSPLSRLSDLMTVTPPRFELYIPGLTAPSEADGQLVSDIISPGSMVMVLTEAEIRTLNNELNPQPPPLSGIGELILLGMLMAGNTGNGASGTVMMTPLERIQERYRGLIRGGIAAPPLIEGGGEDSDDEEDEEFVGPPPPPQPAVIVRANPPTAASLSSGIKKVLTLETFERVCAIVVTPPTDISTEDHEDSCCAICLFHLSGEIRKMPKCVHTFHSPCLSQWLTQNSITCPVCREPVVTETSDYGYLGFGERPDVYTPASEVALAAATSRTATGGPSWLPSFPAISSTGTRIPGGIVTVSARSSSHRQ